MHTPADSPPLELAPLAPDDAPFEAPPPTTTPLRAQCANCGVELLGPHCYACGQPVKGMVRHLSSILADAADTILNIDSRIFRTLWPLFTRPGFLSTEYFAGRRVRYVTPFRLYFFLSIAAFFLIQFALGDITDFNIHNEASDKIAAALTAAEVTTQRDAAIAALKQTELAPGMPEAGSKGIEKAVEAIQKKADKRLDYLHKVDDAKAKGEAPPKESGHGKDNFNFEFDGMPWDAKTHPLHVAWLPQVGNDKLNQLMGRAQENMGKINKDPKPFLLGAISVLPQVLFVLMPLFALLLKIFYIFKRRLYMEHLIVALHSHSFIFLALLALTLTSMTRTWAVTDAPWLATPLGWILFALGWWLPIYLFVMQKKVYKQGWIMTTLKYSMIGISYSILIAFGVAAAFLVSLATT
jgi:hypothetical protein